MKVEYEAQYPFALGAGSAEADHVILVNRVYSPACLDPNTDDGLSTAMYDQIIAARHDAGKPVIVVSCQLPYDAACFAEDDARLFTYGLFTER